MPIVDNAVYFFGYQLENGILIVPFYYNKSNTELNFYSVKDTRELNQRTFKYHSWGACGTPKEIIDRLF